MEIINSRKNNKILHLIKLRQLKNINKEKLFIDEGFKNLLMALANHKVKEIYTIHDFSCQDRDVKIYRISEEVYQKISLLNHGDGYVFICKTFSNDIKKLDNRCIYLDDLQDPGNVGTIIRSALAFGYKQVILSNKCASIYNFKTLSACKGAQYKIEIACLDFDQLLSLKNKDQDIISTTLDSQSIPLSLFPKLDNFILIFGNEGNGINKEIINQSNYKLKIEMDYIDSLNVSIAAGIILYHFK